MNKEILELAKKASQFCIGMEGNISGKTNNGLLIKASGSRLSNLDENDLVGFDMSGNQISNFDKKGSMELGFHTFLLSFPDIKYVSHTHPSNTLKILCSNLCDSFSEKRLFPDQVVFNGAKSCLVPYSKPGNDLTESIKECVNSFIEKEGYFPKVILLKNHGIITCGKTIDECVISTEICDKAAEVFLGAYNMGTINFLSEEQVNDLVFDKNEKYRQELLR